MKKWMESELNEIYPIPPLIEPHRTTSPEIKNILTSPKNPNFQNSNPPSLTLVGGAHFVLL